MESGINLPADVQNILTLESELINFAKITMGLSALYSGCQKNVPVFKRFFLQPYNCATVYTPIPQFGTLL